MQIKACRLVGAKPLPEPMLYHCQLDRQEQNSFNCSGNVNIFIEENALKMLSAKWRPFCLGLSAVGYHYIAKIHSVFSMPTNRILAIFYKLKFGNFLYKLSVYPAFLNLHKQKTFYFNLTAMIPTSHVLIRWSLLNTFVDASMIKCIYIWIVSVFQAANKQLVWRRAISTHPE